MCLLDELGSSELCYLRAVPPWLPPQFVCQTQSFTEVISYNSDCILWGIRVPGGDTSPIPNPWCCTRLFFTNQPGSFARRAEYTEWAQSCPFLPSSSCQSCAYTVASNLEFVFGLNFSLTWKAALHFPSSASISSTLKLITSAVPFSNIS